MKEIIQEIIQEIRNISVEETNVTIDFLVEYGVFQEDASRDFKNDIENTKNIILEDSNSLENLGEGLINLLATKYFQGDIEHVKNFLNIAKNVDMEKKVIYVSNIEDNNLLEQVKLNPKFKASQDNIVINNNVLIDEITFQIQDIISKELRPLAISEKASQGIPIVDLLKKLENNPHCVTIEDTLVRLEKNTDEMIALIGSILKVDGITQLIDEGKVEAIKEIKKPIDDVLDEINKYQNERIEFLNIRYKQFLAELEALPNKIQQIIKTRSLARDEYSEKKLALDIKRDELAIIESKKIKESPKDTEELINAKIMAKSNNKTPNSMFTNIVGIVSSILSNIKGNLGDVLLSMNNSVGDVLANIDGSVSDALSNINDSVSDVLSNMFDGSKELQEETEKLEKEVKYANEDVEILTAKLAKAYESKNELLENIRECRLIIDSSKKILERIETIESKYEYITIDLLHPNPVSGRRSIQIISIASFLQSDSKVINPVEPTSPSNTPDHDHIDNFRRSDEHEATTLKQNGNIMTP